MSIKSNLAYAAAMAGLLTVTASLPANALSMQECSAKYQAAKSAGTLGGEKWNDFRKAQCGDEAAATPARGACCLRHRPPSPLLLRRQRLLLRLLPSRRVQRCFRRHSRRKYASESAGKGRMHTCLDQYKRQQGVGRQWRPEMDSKRRRLLQRVQQASEGRLIPSSRANTAGCLTRAPGRFAFLNLTQTLSKRGPEFPRNCRTSVKRLTSNEP